MDNTVKISSLRRDEALELLMAYNKDAFHIRHGLSVEGVMRYFANKFGFAEEADFWACCGLLHDIDFEMYPEQHCVKAPELLKAAGASEDPRI